MNDEPLRAALDQLRAELGRVGDPVARARLQALVADVEAQLARGGDAAQGSDLKDSLRASIDQFEVEHPRLTLALNQIIASLSSMGI
jgi:type II secretory pathway component PulM